MSSKPETKPKYDFRKCLRKSEVLKPETLEATLAEHEGDGPNEMASALVRKKLLTEWQAKYMLSGRYRLHLGNYQLLERIRRDEFGDRFIALHPQLGRTVQVQVLPVDLTEDAKQRAEFLKKAGCVGELDHPNLDHVFDIDKQQGRYYLVTEHNSGNAVADISTDSLDAISVARIVARAIEGLTYAHSRDVTHERVSSANIFVCDNGNVKISQLALSPLMSDESKLHKENVSPEHGDLLAVVRAGLKLLKKLNSSDQTRQLSALLSKLNTKEQAEFTSALVTLESWLEQQTSDDQPETEASELQHEQHDATSSSAKIVDEETLRITKNARPPRSYNPERRKRRSREHTKLVSSAATVLSLLLVTSLVGVGGYFAFRGFFSDSNAPDVSTPQKNCVSGYAAQAFPEDGTSSEEKQANVESTSSNDLGSPERSLLSGVTNGDRSVAEPKAGGANHLDHSKSSQSELSSMETANSDIGDSGKTGNVFSADMKSTESKLQSFSQTDEPALTEKPKTNASSLAESRLSSTDPVEDKGSSDDLPSSAFDGFPTAVDLPSTDLIEKVALAKLGKNSIHLLGMELRSPEGVGKGRTNFDLKRNESDKQRWSLIAKKTPRSNGDSVGEFSFDKSSGQLTFQWLPEAADSKIANYVRNCVIKLSLADESRTLALRTPLPLPDLKLTREKPFARLDSAIEWLPNPELLTVELQPFKAAGLPKTWIEPAIVQPGVPSAIHFHEAASNRFMWLQLSTDIRNKAGFELKLMLKHVGGTVQPITRTEALKDLADLLVQAAQAAEEEYLANMDVVAPYGQKTKFKDYVAKLKSNAKKTQRQAEIAAENIAIVENFYDKVIPLRVMFRTDEHQVVLVDTSPAAEEDETDE